MNEKLKKREKLLMLFASGKYTYAEVAEIAGITYGYATGFYRVWKKHYELPPTKRGAVGIPKKRKYSKLRENLTEAYRLYVEEKKSLGEIGKIYGGVSRQSVYQMFWQHGLKTRRDNERR